MSAPAPAQEALDVGDDQSTHFLHTDLVPIRENGDGTRIAQLCPGCLGLFHPITGRPLQQGTKRWAAVIEQMRGDLESESKAGSPMGRLSRRLLGKGTK